MRSKKPKKSKTKPALFTIEGGSMWPLLKSGDLVAVRQCRSVRPGAILLYRDEKGSVICHRFHYKKGELFYCKGDAVSIFDRPIFATAIIGEVVLLLRHGKPIQLGKKRYSLLKYGEVALIGPLSRLRAWRHFSFPFHILGNRFAKWWHHQS